MKITLSAVNEYNMGALLYLFEMATAVMGELLDIDAFDPEELPGVSVPVPSGFHIPDAYTMMGAFLEHLPVAAIDIVEYNMVHDKDHVTSNFLVDLIEYITK